MSTEFISTFEKQEKRHFPQFRMDELIPITTDKNVTITIEHMLRDDGNGYSAAGRLRIFPRKISEMDTKEAETLRNLDPVSLEYLNAVGENNDGFLTYTILYNTVPSQLAINYINVSEKSNNRRNGRAKAMVRFLLKFAKERTRIRLVGVGCATITSERLFESLDFEKVTSQLCILSEKCSHRLFL